MRLTSIELSVCLALLLVFSKQVLGAVAGYRKANKTLDVPGLCCRSWEFPLRLALPCFRMLLRLKRPSQILCVAI